MSGRAPNSQGDKKRKSKSSEGVEPRRSKRVKSLRPDAFLPARFGPKFPPDAQMNHRVILEIPAWTRRKLDKWLGKLQLEKGIESSVDLSSFDLTSFPLLSRPVPHRPGRVFEMDLGSTPTSPQFVDNEDFPTIPPLQAQGVGCRSDSAAHPVCSQSSSHYPPGPSDSSARQCSVTDSANIPILMAAQPVIIIPSSEDDV